MEDTSSIPTTYSDSILGDRKLYASLEQLMIVSDRDEMLDHVEATLAFVKMISGGGKKGLSIINHELSLNESIAAVKSLLGKRKNQIVPKDKLAIHSRFEGITGNYTLLDPTTMMDSVAKVTEYSDGVIQSQKGITKAKDFTLPKDIAKRISTLKKLISQLNGSVRLVTKKQLHSLNVLKGKLSNEVDYVEVSKVVDKTIRFLENSVVWIKSIDKEVSIPKQLHLLYVLTSKLAASYVVQVASTVKMETVVVRFIGKHLNFIDE